MAEAQIASRPPTACAGCYGGYPERVHVDFRSAIEGGPVHDGPRAPRVDWVVLCENCVRQAYALLPEVAGERDRLKAELEQQRTRADVAEGYARDLEAALARRPEAIETPPAPEAPAPDPARENQERQIAQLIERAEAAENRVAVLEDALQHEPTPEAPARQRKSKPKAAAGGARKNRYAR